ncbi:MAG: ATP-binding protein, partial [Anaerolineae bacterium]|nr:ATP-binding protein [Anaerolineae bacterium]
LKMVLPDADTEIREYLGLIETEANNAATIVSDLLDYGRIKTSDRKPVQVKTLIEASLVKIPVPEGVLVDCEIPEDITPVWVDQQQIDLILNNLVVNAYQAMPDGGKLLISCEQYAGHSRESHEGEGQPRCWVRICVRDTGTGITVENMAKLFEPLFTTKHRGIGLGLATSKNLAEVNGGYIEVASQVGEGTSFTLHMPCQEAAPSES